MVALEPTDHGMDGGAVGGIADALMREIVESLAALAEHGTPNVIDLASLPMAPIERDRLAEALGTGEVTATVEVTGTSEVRETGYAGVWWVRHFGAAGRLASEHIEIAEVPEILRAHRDDIAEAVDRLAEFLDQQQPERLDKDRSHV